MPDPRDPRRARHDLAAVLALSACAVLTGATSLLAVGEWIADAPTCVLERLGIRCDPLLPGPEGPKPRGTANRPAGRAYKPPPGSPMGGASPGGAAGPGTAGRVHVRHVLVSLPYAPDVTPHAAAVPRRHRGRRACSGTDRRPSADCR
ncbi:transposase family protein [Streptomyces netropsis]|uniref:transposase family protein n=1 Tax=Streptomyces netropsis TaxID=55404 RepID=UPI001E30C297|nr:transposase family protein [Streptomyces netropsis]